MRHFGRGCGYLDSTLTETIFDRAGEMKPKCARSLFLLAGVLLAGGCLATDPTIDDPELPELVTFQSVEVGALHSCGLTLRNEILCWGENSTGQLGTGDDISRTIPWPVSHGTIEFSRVVPGAAHSCALSLDNEVYCWGSNNAGQLGLGNLSDLQVSVPVEVGGGRSYISVEVGGAHSCALSTSRAAFCWGNGAQGQLGTGDVQGVPRPAPDSVVGGIVYELLTAGNEHTCGLTVSGESYCWGSGQHGRLGVGSSSNLAEPTLVGNNMQFFAISAGGTHTCALGLDGTAYCWGDASQGQLGTGALDGSEVPVPVSGTLVFDDISAGNGYTCAITGVGDVYCWGRNEVGQLGDGTLVDRYEPTLVGGGRAFQNVSTGLGAFGTATCGLGADGLAYCWGDGLGGQTGTGDPIVATSPIRVYGQAG